jgi:ferredoxin
MDQITTIALNIIGLVVILVFGVFGLVSFSEREQRAASIAAAIAVLGGAIFLLISFLPLVVKQIVLAVITLGVICFIILFTLPVGRVMMGRDTPSQRFDERRIMFARARLVPGSPEYQAYYASHPEHKASDDKTRLQPGLLSLEAKFGNPYLFAPTHGSFFLTGNLREAVDGPVATERMDLPVEEMTAYIFGLARYFGALDVGVAPLEPHHVYSHTGRGTGTYGAPIPVEHKYALAFTVEMDFDMVGTAPGPQILMESGRQYVEASRVAVQLAAAIRKLGYPARAHIDGNYQVIAPLVARDAGLGEIGRMSLLMTPRQGPRVRLGVVTTSMELVPNRRQPDPSVIDFCNICKKCAEACPSRSIPFDDRQLIEGALRWKINPDTCFRYWSVAGTDCGRCMAVCPYAHPDTFSHNLIRWGISKSGFFRRAALWMDDLLYGKKPPPRDPPGWVRVG